MALTLKQEEACKLAVEWWSKNLNQIFVISGFAGCGKCHGKGTRLLMWDGSTKLVEDIQVGDLLMGDDSTPRKVFPFHGMV